MSAVLQEQIPAVLEARLPVTEEISRELQASGAATRAATEMVVDSPLMAQEAADELNNYKRAIVRIDGLYKGFIAPAKQILDHAASIFKPRLDDFKQAETILKGKLADWNTREQQRIALENKRREDEDRAARQRAEQEAAAARAKAAEEARQKEEKARQERETRERAEREAAEATERARKAKEAGDAEAARKAEAERREAERTAKESAQREAKATEQASAAIENGEAAASQAHLQAAAVATSAPIEQAKVAGIQMRDNWIAVMTAATEDEAKAAICAEVSSRPELLAYLKLDLAAIGRSSKAQKNVMRIPGFKAENCPIVAGQKR